MDHQDDTSRMLARDFGAYLRFLRDGGLVFAGATDTAPPTAQSAAPAVPVSGRSPVEGIAARAMASEEQPQAAARPTSPVDAPSSRSEASAAPSALPGTPAECLPPEQRESAWQALCEEIANCRACRLHESRTNVVPGVGSLTADLMFIGEGPGGDEDRQGIPFVGRAGHKLNEMIAYLGLTRDDVCIVNIVKCRPPGNRNPERDEAAACRAFLERQIAIVRPKVLCLLGAVALKHITNKMTVSITRMRGQWLEYAGIPTLPTFHPAYLLRAYTRTNRMAVASDMDAIRDKFKSLGCMTPEKPGEQ